jgi:putative flippase GtrA
VPDHIPTDRLAGLIGAGRARALRQFLKFGVVGTIGFLVDTAVLYAALWAGLGLYWGRALSYVAAASGNWLLNRAWTFRGADNGPGGLSPARQWAAFLAVNLVGFGCNYGTYAILVGTVPFIAAHPVLGVASGSIAGLASNFLLSRRFVFRAA